MLVQRSLGLEDGLRVVNTVIEYAKAHNWRVAVVVLDNRGEHIASARMDGRHPRFYKAAYRKAYSAATFEMDTDHVTVEAVPSATAWQCTECTSRHEHIPKQCRLC